MLQPGYQPLIGIQITTAHLQTNLTPKIPELKALRPTVTSNLIILFVVPDNMMQSFVLQPFKDAKKNAHWQEKTAHMFLVLIIT